jgi:hypothetical protein
MIKSSDLMHGDVLLYKHNLRKSSFIVKCIHLITGADVEHASIIWEVDRNKYVLEQLPERTHSLLKFYYELPGEDIIAVRPLFPIPDQDDKEMFRRENYGYSSIIDCLLNHAMGRITFGHWKYRPIIRKYYQKELINCSGLVALMLKLTENVEWCKYPSVVEPGTILSHGESFIWLGPVDWS